jgi:hypothetical protein
LLPEKRLAMLMADLFGVNIAAENGLTLRDGRGGLAKRFANTLWAAPDAECRHFMQSGAYSGL